MAAPGREGAGRENPVPLVARRKMGQSWREAVAGRAGPDRGCLPAFDALIRAGLEEAEAAFRVLEERELLWRVDEPGAEAPTRSEKGNVPAV